MKKIKLLLLLFMLVVFAMLSCTTTDSKHQQIKKNKTYFLDEDFVIIKASETPSENGLELVRMWVIQRVKNAGDSIEVAEIGNKESSSYFYITKELWYNKEVGSTLHFDYILKKRFFKIKNERKPFLLTGNEEDVLTDDLVGTDELTVVDEDLTKLDNLEIEDQLVDLEEQLESIQDEIEKIRDDLDYKYY